jgi:RNA recognition motif-containing protein
MDTKLYVGNLSKQVTEEDLRTLFAPAGTIQSVAIPTDRATNAPRGFALVDMSTAEEANAAVTLGHGQMLREQEIRVQISKPKSEQVPAKPAL